MAQKSVTIEVKASKEELQAIYQTLYGRVFQGHSIVTMTESDHIRDTMKLIQALIEKV